MQRNKQATRRAEFKKKLTANDIRQRRDSATQLLRKNKREESLMKRRFARSSDGAEDAKTTQQDIAVLNNDADSQKLVNDLQSSEFAVVLSATTQIRRMLSIERDPPIDRVLQMGVLPRLVSFLQCWDTQPQLALEAAWAITNVASGTSAHTRAVVEAGAVPMFVQLLGCASESLRDQCVWALGNIAGDGSELRDMCLEQNVMQALLYQFTQDPSEGILRNTTWAVSNLCRGKPAPEFEKVRMCIPALTQLLHHQDKDTTVDAAWALSYLTDGDDNKIQAVVEAGVCARLVEMLSSDDKTIQTPSLRAVGNIVTGTASQTQAIVDTNPFASLAQLLHSSKRSIVKEACWTLSNITAGEQGQIQTVIDAGLMSSLADKLSVGEFDVQKEACWAISNATTGGTPEQIRSFVEEKTIKGLISIAGKQDAKIANVALEALENILNAGEIDGVDNIYLDWFEEHEGVDLLEDLQDHQNDALYNRAVDMTEKFFDGEEDEANAENIAPNVVTHNNQSTFAFGLSGNANNQQTPSTGFAF